MTKNQTREPASKAREIEARIRCYAEQFGVLADRLQTRKRWVIWTSLALLTIGLVATLVAWTLADSAWMLRCGDSLEVLCKASMGFLIAGGIAWVAGAVALRGEPEKILRRGALELGFEAREFVRRCEKTEPPEPPEDAESDAKKEKDPVDPALSRVSAFEARVRKVVASREVLTAASRWLGPGLHEPTADEIEKIMNSESSESESAADEGPTGKENGKLAEGGESAEEE